MRSETGLAILLLLIASVLLGFAPTTTKLSFAQGANPQFVILFRVVFATLGLGVFLMLRGQPLAVGRAHVATSAVTGISTLVGLGAALVSLAYIDVSLATIIWYAHVFFIAMVNHLRGVSRLTLLQVGFILLALIGLAIALGVKLDDVDLVGVAFAFIAAAGLTAMILSGAKTTAAVGPIRANMHMNFWAAIYGGVLLLALPGLGWIAPAIAPQTGWGWVLVVFSAAAFSLGFLLFFAAARIIGATRAAVITIAEPILMVLFAVAIIGEVLVPWQWVGVAMVIISLFAMEASQLRERASD